jgi:nitrogen-specific signal transduction histidine kinase
MVFPPKSAQRNAIGGTPGLQITIGIVSRFWSSSMGKPSFFQKMLGRKSASSPIVKTDDLFHFLECVPGPAFVVDADLHIIHVNENLHAMLGFPAVETVLGKAPGDALSCVKATRGNGCGKDPDCAFCQARKRMTVTAQGGQVQRGECTLLLKRDGHTLSIQTQMVSMPFVTKEGPVSVVTMHDITRERWCDTLEQMFFHDWANHIAGLSGVTELLTDQAQISDRSELVRLMRRSVQALVDEMRFFRLMRSAEQGWMNCSWQTIDLTLMVEELVHQYQAPDKSGGCPITLSSPGTISIISDPVLLRRCLRNLLVNALESWTGTGEVRLKLSASKDLIRIDVASSSVIPSENQPEIFKRGFSTKGRGRGIGTWSVKLLIEDHLAGTVTFISNPQDGTVFTLLLPSDGQAQIQKIHEKGAKKCAS